MRGISMKLSAGQIEALKPASSMAEYQEEYDKGGLARHTSVGESIVKDAASFGGHDGSQSTKGIGRSWTTDTDLIDGIAVSGGETLVRFTAKPRTSDIIASNVKGKEFGLDTGAAMDMMGGESEVRLKGGAPVDIVNVEIRNPYPGEKWLQVWAAPTESRHGAHNQKDHGRPGGFDVSRGGKQGKEFGSRSPMIGDMTEAGEALAMQVMSGMPGMGGVMTKEAAVVEVEARLQATIDEALARGFSADRALASAQWYDVANDYSAGLSDEFGFTHPETGAAVLATLSPSAAWEGNVRNGRELMKKVGENKPITDADVELALGRKVSKIEASLSRGGIPDKRKAELEEALSKLKDPAVLADAKGRMVGKKFNDADPDDQVAVLNGHIQGNAMRGISLVPNKDGTYTVEDYASKTTVQSNAIVKKAIKIAIADKNGASADEMTDIISKNVSQESKVRAFYQNIANPNDTIQSAVTLDTHAFSGAFSPVNAVTSKVLFASSRDIGYAKTYPIVRESMASLAPKLSAQLGASEVMSPRAVQSVTWEMTRFLYPMSGKGRVLKGLGPGEYFTTPDIDAAYASGNHQRAVSLLATAMGGPTG